MHWVLMPFRRAFDYSGRSSRKEFFSFFLVFWLAIPMAFAILYPAMGARPGASDTLLIAVALVLLVLLVPTVPLMVRRFHDFGWSGWWLILLLVPVAGVVAATAILVWVEGTFGENRFGPGPR
jgi:uncharacterized membrane protein YhaH (DUF805 family)